MTPAHDIVQVSIPMRTLFLLVVTSMSAWSQTGRPIDNPDLQEAKKPVELWMRRQLLIFEEAVPRLPGGPTLVLPREAVAQADSIAISTSQLKSFQSGHELAQFLAHAAAHARLGHPERMATLRKAVGILGPGRPASVLQAETLAQMEKEAAATAPELMQTAACTPASCPIFDALLRAALP